MKQALHKQFLKSTYFLGVFLILSCGSRSAVLSTPIGNIDLTPLKAVELTDTEEKEWSHLDLKTDTIPGVSLQRAYKELVKPKSKTIIVAVIDSGIDIDHEDLKEKYLGSTQVKYQTMEKTMTLMDILTILMVGIFWEMQAMNN